ncbi:MAG TPA: hypothetical protein V6C76_03000 [Drouetiella sp.]
MTLASKIIEGGVEVASKVVAGGAAEAGAPVSAKAVGELLLEEVSLGAKPVSGSPIASAFKMTRPPHLEAQYNELTQSLALDAAGQQKLDGMVPMVHEAILNIVKKGPESSELVRSQIANLTATDLASGPTRLVALMRLEHTVPPETFQALKQLEPSGKGVLDSVDSLVTRSPEGLGLVNRLIAEGAPASDFQYGRLAAHWKLESSFGAESDTMKKLLDLEKTQGLQLDKAVAVEHPELIKRIVANDEAAAATINEIGINNGPFRPFAAAMGADHVDALERASSMFTKNGLNVRGLNEFLGRQPGADRIALVASEINKGTAVEQLNNPTWLPSMRLLQKHIAPELVDKAVKLGEQGKLDTWNVGAFVDSNPAQRASFVEGMLASGTPEKIKDVAKLSMFSQETAEEVARRAASGEFRVQDLLHHARDLQSGQNFVALTAERVQKGLPLSKEILDSLAVEAAHTPPLVPNFVTRGSVATVTEGLDRPIWPGELKYADKLNAVTNIMLNRFAPDRPLVMLARDMDAFTPVLRAHGRETINFPFSRLQLGDPVTKARWMAEVPPNAVVVDSKLHGTILGEIQRFDPSIEPYLLQSRSRFTQLVPDTGGMTSIADSVEYFPKLTGRSSGFRPSGAAVSRWKNVDDHDITAPSLMAIELRQSILQDLKLSDWHVWRYKTFTGVPQSERLGITSPGRIQTYLDSVANLRANS